MSNPSAAQEDRTSGVIPAAPWRVTTVSALPGYRLAVTFRDGQSGIVDCSAIRTCAQPGIYAALADPVFFQQVGIELGVVTWPNGADLDPAWMHESLRGQETWFVPF